MITAMQARLRVWWQGLEARQQKLLLVSAPLIAGLLIYWLLTQLNWSSASATVSTNLAANNLARLEALQTRLPPLVELNQTQWEALAVSAGLQQVQVQAQNSHWLVSARAGQMQQVEKFLLEAAAQGWQWQALKLQGAPIHLTVELLPL